MVTELEIPVRILEKLSEEEIVDFLLSDPRVKSAACVNNVYCIGTIEGEEIQIRFKVKENES